MYCVLRADDWHLRKPYKIVNCQLTRSDGKPGEHDGSGGEELLDEDGLETPWLGGALAALHSSLMEDVWPASMAAFSCFPESTSAPDTRRTNLECEVSISGEMGALLPRLGCYRGENSIYILQKNKSKVAKTNLWSFRHAPISIIIKTDSFIVVFSPQRGNDVADPQVNWILRILTYFSTVSGRCQHVINLKYTSRPLPYW